MAAEKANLLVREGVWVENAAATYFSAAEKLGSWLWLAGFSSRGEAATVQWASRLLARSSREGAAAGVYHTPEGSPPGGACLDQGPGFYTH